MVNISTARINRKVNLTCPKMGTLSAFCSHNMCDVDIVMPISRPSAREMRGMQSSHLNPFIQSIELYTYKGQFYKDSYLGGVWQARMDCKKHLSVGSFINNSSRFLKKIFLQHEKVFACNKKFSASLHSIASSKEKLFPYISAFEVVILLA